MTRVSNASRTADRKLRIAEIFVAQSQYREMAVIRFTDLLYILRRREILTSKMLSQNRVPAASIGALSRGRHRTRHGRQIIIIYSNLGKIFTAESSERNESKKRITRSAYDIHWTSSFCG